MRRYAWPAALVVVTAAAVNLPAADPGPAGTWLLSYSPPATTNEFNVCILKVDGTTAKVVAVPPKSFPQKVKSVAVAGSRVAVTFENGTAFTGVVGKSEDVILGAYGNDNVQFRAKLTRTDKDEISAALTPGKQHETFAEAAKLTNKAALLRFQARSAKDAEKKKDLLAQADEAAKEADAKVPGLYRQVVEKSPDQPAALDAAVALIGLGAKADLKADEAAKLITVIGKQAAPFGPDYARFVTVQAAEGLAAMKGLEKVAADALRPVVKTFTDKDPPAAVQVKVLTALKTALTPAGGAELKEVDGKLTKLETRLDEEYLASVPPFKPAPYEGRKDNAANRTVVLELFTGAQCPPCVAADVAFDALGKSYKASDVVLVQYHMHIPGPDPLTNRDTIARWDYYSERFPKDIRGTPSTLFNGTPKAGGGGGMANAEAKFEQYTKVINPLLEETTPVKLTGRASRNGDKVEIAVEYAGVPVGGEGEPKLRLLLVEETVKYVGGNKLRFHHAVVRAMPGGAEGTAIKDKAGKQTATVDVTKVRADLTKYLDEYAANERPFPSQARPMEMAKLQVIALVQDDKSGEILQAARFDVAAPGVRSE
jgi:hypothetical protein